MTTEQTASVPPPPQRPARTVGARYAPTPRRRACASGTTDSSSTTTAAATLFSPGTAAGPRPAGLDRRRRSPRPRPSGAIIGTGLVRIASRRVTGLPRAPGTPRRRSTRPTPLPAPWSGREGALSIRDERWRGHPASCRSIPCARRSDRAADALRRALAPRTPGTHRSGAPAPERNSHPPRARRRAPPDGHRPVAPPSSSWASLFAADRHCFRHLCFARPRATGCGLTESAVRRGRLIAPGSARWRCGGAGRHAAYALTTYDLFSTDGSDGHFQWCAALLNRDTAVERGA